jgi:hypothetical protein
MSKPNALRAMSPLELRFTDPEDVATYGDGWYRYDEGRYLRLRARDQITLEGALGMPLVSIMNGFRSSTGLGETAAAWLAIQSVNPALAGDFDDFNPLTNMIEWRDAQGKAEAPEATQLEPALAQPDTLSPENPDLPMAGSWVNTTSVPMDTVVLPNLPIAE